MRPASFTWLSPRSIRQRRSSSPSVSTETGYPFGSGFRATRRTRQKGNAFQEMGGKGVAEGVAGGALGDAGSADGGSHGSLYDRFMQMVAADLVGRWVSVGAGCREDPLPGPLPAGAGVLAGEGLGELDPSPAATHIGRGGRACG
jgi:hypothetical protein